MSQTHKTLNGANLRPFFDKPTEHKLDRGLMACMFCVVIMACLTLVNIWCVDRMQTVARDIRDIGQSQERAAQDEVKRLELVHAARDREVEDDAKLLVQQRANLEAAKRLGKILNGDK